MRLLAAAAWLGGTVLIAGPLSSMKPMKFDHAEFSKFEGARPAGFYGYGIYKFAEHEKAHEFDFHRLGGFDRWHYEERKRCRDVRPSAAPEPGYEWALGLVLIAFGAMSGRRKTCRHGSNEAPGH